MYVIAIKSNSCHPFFVFAVEPDPYTSTFISWVNGAISSILSVSNDTKIFNSVVIPDMVYVVNLHSIGN